MTGEFAENTQEPGKRLAEIEQHFSETLDSNTVEFSHLLVDRLNSQIVGGGFALASQLLLIDLRSGLNGYTGQPIDSELVGKSEAVYNKLSAKVPALADFAFSSEFARNVGEFIGKITGPSMYPADMTTEQILADPTEDATIMNPNSLPDADEVRIAAELSDGTKLYVDQGVLMLGNEFDPATYTGPHMSAYHDFSVEALSSPLVALGKANDQYYGVDLEGLEKLINPNPRVTTLFGPERIPELGTAELNGKTIYFPTDKLLEAYGVVRRGIDAPEAAMAGILSYLMNHSSFNNETPRAEETLPEIELPGFDPFDLVRSQGTLPAEGILFEAKFVRGGGATFGVYNYDNVGRVSLDEQGEDGEYQYLHVSFDSKNLSEASQLDFMYEQPGYFAKTEQPYNRTGEYSYIGFGFNELDVVDTASGGRLLCVKQPYMFGGLSTRFDQTPWKQHPFDGYNRRLVRWFPKDDVEKLGETLQLITTNLMGIDTASTDLITRSVISTLRKPRKTEW